MTRGKAGHYWRRKSTDPFEPFAVVLTASGTYGLPSGATTMKAWAIGGGSSGAGGCAYKSWSILESDEAPTFTVGAGAYGQNVSAGSTSLTFRGTTITGNGGNGYATFAGGSFSGGDGGANGGSGSSGEYGSFPWQRRNGGAVGGNGTWTLSVLRMPATDVNGLFAAVSLAGLKTVEDGGAEPAFGSGGGTAQTDGDKGPGIGGGDSFSPFGGRTSMGGSGAVVLYFT
jgi:hypothetical protein